jgi:hypothetical protein
MVVETRAEKCAKEAQSSALFILAGNCVRPEFTENGSKRKKLWRKE